VRRSYFSRILPGSDQPALIPPRPITSVWKAAQIERSRQSDLSYLSTEPNLSPRSTRPARRNADAQSAPHVNNTESVSGTNIGPALATPAFAQQFTSRRSSSSATGSFVAGTKDAATSQSKTAAASIEHSHTGPGPTVPRDELHATELMPNREQSRKAQNIELPSMPQRTDRATPKEPSSIARHQAKEPSAALPSLDPSLPAHPVERQLPPTSSPTLREAVSANARAEVARLFSSPTQATPAKQASSSATSHPVPQVLPAPVLLEPTQPQHPSKTTARQASHSRAAQPAEAPRSAVTIGKIEVQIVPPVTQIRPPAPAPQARPRLARGYALWAGR
jgi:hypothetical protein